MSTAKTDPGGVERWRMWPLYAAGFTTAFGAHAVAANLAFDLDDMANSLLYLGLLLALYDGAEVLLKPVFGTLADKVGGETCPARRVDRLRCSISAVRPRRRHELAVARSPRPSAAASAFSPAASSLVARLTPRERRGSAFGTYGFYKSLGYTSGRYLVVR